MFSWECVHTHAHFRPGVYGKVFLGAFRLKVPGTFSSGDFSLVSFKDLKDSCSRLLSRFHHGWKSHEDYANQADDLMDLHKCSAKPAPRHRSICHTLSPVTPSRSTMGQKIILKHNEKKTVSLQHGCIERTAYSAPRWPPIQIMRIVHPAHHRKSFLASWFTSWLCGPLNMRSWVPPTGPAPKFLLSPYTLHCGDTTDFKSAFLSSRKVLQIQNLHGLKIHYRK